MNLHGVALLGEPAGRAGNLRLGVAGHLHAAREVRRRKGLAHGDARRRRIDARGGLVDMAGQELVDHPAVAYPVVGEDTAARDQHGQNDGENRQRPARD